MFSQKKVILLKLFSRKKISDLKLKKIIIKENLTLQITKVSGGYAEISDKKIHRFTLASVKDTTGVKRKMNQEIVESIMIARNQKFDCYEIFNAIEIKIKDDNLQNLLSFQFTF